MRRRMQMLQFLVLLGSCAHIFLAGAAAVADHSAEETSDGKEWDGDQDEGIEVSFTKLVPRIYTPVEGSSPTLISGRVTNRSIPQRPLELRLTIQCASAEHSEEAVVEARLILRHPHRDSDWDSRLDLHAFGPCRDARLQISSAASSTKVLAMGQVAIYQLVVNEMAWADHRMEQRLSPVDLGEARGLASMSAREFAGTATIDFDEVVAASVNQQGNDLKLYWITVECNEKSDQVVCANGSLFLFGLREGIVDGAVQYEIQEARRVAARVPQRKLPSTKTASHSLAKWRQDRNVEGTESNRPRKGSSASQPIYAWRKQGRCLATEAVIDEALKPWLMHGAKIRRRDVEALANSRNVICVKIVSNRLYMNFERLPGAIYGLDQPPNSFPLWKWYAGCLALTLMDVLNEFQVPDLEFCGGNETPKIIKGDKILIPDVFFTYWSGSRRPMHEWYSPPRDFSGVAHEISWGERIPLLYWRGTVNTFSMLGSRGRLVQLSLERPDLIDAKALRLVEDAAEDQCEAANASRKDHNRIKSSMGVKVDAKNGMRYKFLMSTHGPGNHWSNRFRSLLSMGSLVFKQKATLYEFWEQDLVPFEHYVPVNEDLSNLVEMVEWALEHDDKAQRIASNGVRFVKEKLGEERITCYWAELLTLYGSLIDYRPEVDSNVISFLPFY